jgi:hypothetical protein
LSQFCGSNLMLLLTPAHGSCEQKDKCEGIHLLWFRERSHTKDSRGETASRHTCDFKTNSHGNLQRRGASRQCLGESPSFHCELSEQVVQTIQCRRAVMAPHADRRDSVGESPDSMRHYWAMSEALIQRGGSAPSWPAQGGIVGERPCTRAFGLIALTPRHKKRTQCVCNPSTSRYESLR